MFKYKFMNRLMHCKNLEISIKCQEKIYFWLGNTLDKKSLRSQNYHDLKKAHQEMNNYMTICEDIIKQRMLRRREK